MPGPPPTVSLGTHALAGYGELLEAVRGVRWPARRRISGGPSGSHRSKRRGLAVEFTEYRAYRQGDDPRQLDWKLLARTDRAYVRLAEEHAVLPTVFVVDASASLAYPLPGLGKWVQAEMMVVGLAAIAHAAGDPVGAVVASPDGPWVVPPRTRRSVIAEIGSALARRAPGGNPALAPAVARARGLLRQGGRLVIISDFLGEGPDDGIVLAGAGAEVVSAGADCVAVHIAAAEELDPPWKRALVADPERLDVRRPLVGATRAAYLARFAAWREELARAWRGAGATYALVVTDDRPARAVCRIARGDGV
ncbi:MAG TPA: DUF58 domain-containing protein [Gemmatimonadaceae bacterium]|jgi:uncharacterized protein (DUF58 family)|nr:DUF58 domain-containing protein [Gemmatimonadaceae bacterium]